jgi:hypothetical protein
VYSRQCWRGALLGGTVFLAGAGCVCSTYGLGSKTFACETSHDCAHGYSCDPVSFTCRIASDGGGFDSGPVIDGGAADAASLDAGGEDAASCSKADSGLGDHLVGYWKFDETSGTTIIDSSGNGNDGYLGTGPATGATEDPIRVGGLFDGGALSFNGTQNLCTVPNSPTLGSLSAFTYVAWIYPTGFGGSGFGRILSKESDAGFDENYFLIFAFDGTSTQSLGAELDGATTKDTIAAASGIVLNTWQQVAVTYEDCGDRKAHLYVNGHEVSYVAQPAVSGTFVRTSHPFIIGNRPGLDRGFSGIIDDVQVYNAALTASEIASLYSTP